MGSLNPNGQTPAQQRALRAIWDQRPEVIDWTARVRAQIDAEDMKFDAAGLTRAFAIAREQGGDQLPDSGIRATG